VQRGSITALTEEDVHFRYDKADHTAIAEHITEDVLQQFKAVHETL